MKPSRTLNSKYTRIAKPALAIGAIYGLWVFASMVIYGMGGLFPDMRFHAMMIPLMTLVYVLLAFYLTAFFIIYAQDSLFESDPTRIGCILATVAAGVLIYGIVQRFHVSGPLIDMLGTANLLVFANLVGAWMVKPVKRMAELSMLCVVAALADLFSFLRGPTRVIAESLHSYYTGGMQGIPPAGDFLLIKVAVPGMPYLKPLFGVSDWIIIVFLSAAAVRFGIDDNLTGESLSAMVRKKRVSLYFPVTGAALMIAILAAYRFNIFVPVLPVVAAVFIAYLLLFYPRSRDFTRRDWVLLTGFSLVMLALLGAGVVLNA